MSDTEQNVDSKPASSPAVMPGAELKAGREKAGLSISELGATLRLDRAVIESLEGDDYDTLPAAIFTRGYIRNYAVAVGLAPGPLCAAYDAAVQPVEQAVPQQKQPQKSSKIWLWLLLLLIAAAALVWWYSGPPLEAVSTESVMPIKVDESEQQGVEAESVSNDSQRANPNPAVVAAFQIANSENGTEVDQGTVASSPSAPSDADAEPSAISIDDVSGNDADGVAAPAAADVSEEVTQPEVAALPVESSASQEGSEDASPAANAATAPSSSENEELEEVPSQTVDFRLVATEDCWVEITDGNGKTRVARTLRAGQFRELTVIAPVKFVVGNAKMASLTVAGEEYDLMRHRRAGSATARFTLNAE